ncbi:MAG: CoA pyrophosphatase [Reinekea sp.]|jgi:8-oxo-dGTP pyrophosphatase MutT (NUDIX family)
MNDFFDIESRLKRRFIGFKPGIIEQTQPYAAVLVPVVIHPEPSILLTVRASHLSSHPGQVSFPGGMYEPDDLNVIDTALRETFEEVALAAERFDVVGELSTVFSKDGVLVYPVVAVTQDIDGGFGNPDEIHEIFTVPWRFFVENKPELQPIERHGMSFMVPHFYYQGRHIWGLTAMIILELVNLLEDMNYPVPDFSQVKR